MSSYAEVGRLIDGRRRRRHIVALASEAGKAGDIVDRLDRLDLIRRQGGRLEWVGPEPPSLLRLLAGLQDGPTGPIVDLSPGGTCPVFVYAAPESKGELPGYLVGWGGAAGTGTDRRAAALSCLFETAERCAQMRHGDEPTRDASYSQIASDAVHPDRLTMASPHDGIAGVAPVTSTPIAPLAPDRPISWVAARHLGSDERRWLPTDFCYRSERRGERGWTCPADSSGCSTGRSVEDIAVRGFLELVERDAVAIWWFNRIGRPSLPPGIAERPAIRSIAAWQRQQGRGFHLIDLTTDLGIPVVAAISHATSGRGIAVGFGAGLDLAAAALRAALEMTQFQVMIELSLNYRDSGQAGDASPATEVARQWFETVSTETEPYLLPLPEARPVARSTPDDRNLEPEEALDLCLSIAATRGLELLYLDMTRPWIGIPAGRVVVPGLRSPRRRFGEGRLYDVPIALGWLPTPRHVEELNRRWFVF